jgi:uncharacterized membrane protein
MVINRKRIATLAIIIGGSLLLVAVILVIIIALVKLIVPAADYFECFIISVDLLLALSALLAGYLVFIIVRKELHARKQLKKISNGAKS